MQSFFLIMNHSQCLEKSKLKLVNGLNGPNKEVECTTGKISYDLKESCTVKGRDVTDIYPFIFYDSTIEPLTNAADYVLKSAK